MRREKEGGSGGREWREGGREGGREGVEEKGERKKGVRR